MRRLGRVCVAGALAIAAVLGVAIIDEQSRLM